MVRMLIRAMYALFLLFLESLSTNVLTLCKNMLRSLTVGKYPQKNQNSKIGSLRGTIEEERRERQRERGKREKKTERER